MRIRNLLQPQDLLTLDEAASVLEAAQAMSAKKVGAVIVTRDGGRLAGIFTERDLMSRVVVALRNPETVLLREVMTRDVFSVDLDAEVKDVRTELQVRHIRHLPIVADGRIVGILSLRDLLRADIDAMSIEVQALESYFLGGPEVA
jgi:signal-transduction protein with cAMP-binding, CBS, and nucleotidyltransferase domain